ncbi:MAG: DUF1273 family protein [Clostridia bacterium]|nr:DUF1273 family protein [Clostridia bacterium]
MDNKSVTCCFTGHRTVAQYHREQTAEAVLAQIRALRDRGFTRFIAGGALGFDTLAALCVLKEAETDPDIRLILAVPCLNQTEKWSSLPGALEHLRTYKEIMGKADEVIYTSERTYFDGCMKIRNQFMVDHAAVCIAYWNGSRGGTSQTVRMAEKAGLEIINVYKSK